MAFFDNLKKLLGFDEKPEIKEFRADSMAVPLKIFRKFQDDMQEGMRTMRTEFNKLVEENHALKIQVSSVTLRFDKFQQEQSKHSFEIQRDLKNLTKVVADSSKSDDKSLINISNLDKKAKSQQSQKTESSVSEDKKNQLKQEETIQKQISSARNAINSMNTRVSNEPEYSPDAPSSYRPKSKPI